MYTPEEQNAIRLDMFRWLDLAVERNAGVLNRQMIEAYSYEGQPIKLANPGRGIWNPVKFDCTVSIVHKYNGPYDDELKDGNFLTYHYEASDPDGGSNRKLRKAARTLAPLIYFHGIAPNLYVPYYPVYIVEDLPASRVVIVALDEALVPRPDSVEAHEIERAYVERVVRSRVHQREFRAKVLAAYENTCAVCQLRQPELLDAAHITPDSSETGIAFTPNGLALCKIHHAAYDSNLLGIDGRRQIHLAPRLNLSAASEMRRAAFDSLGGRRLKTPRTRALYPDPERLEQRFHLFTQSMSA